MPRKRKRPKKNPWAAAILNFLWGGLGYIYAGKRRNFGILVALAMLIAAVEVIMFNIPTLYFSTSSFVLGLAFAYDVYREVK